MYRTRLELIALAGLISRKGITIEEEEWKEATGTIAAAHQVDLLFDPRVQRGEELLRRILSGEEISDDEMDRWLRDVGEHDK